MRRGDLGRVEWRERVGVTGRRMEGGCGEEGGVVMDGGEGTEGEREEEEEEEEDIGEGGVTV